jgi:predicted SnoaL-like aldol condensation-catalyzing enzyme
MPTRDKTETNVESMSSSAASTNAQSDPEGVVRRYLTVLYNDRRLDLIPELLADPEIRHAPGETKVVSLQENTERLEKMLAACPVLKFEPSVVVTQGDLVSVAWNGWSTQTDGRTYEFAAIEMFRVHEGRIVEIWNAREAKGLWS